jgi:hypothetical protein
MAGCGANLKFYMFSCISGGSTNDCIAWEMSDLRKLIEIDGKLPPQFYIISDEAITTTNQVLSPWSGRGLGDWKDSFNYHLSAMRQCIERAFGLLTQRWGIFWRPLRCAFDKWPLVCSVAAKLHNFCIDEEGSHDHELQMRYNEDYEVGDSPEVVLNDYTEAEIEEQMRDRNLVLNRRATGDRRDFLTNSIQNLGTRRPSHSMFSRA